MMRTFFILIVLCSGIQAIDVKVENIPLRKIIISEKPSAKDREIAQEAARIIQVLTGKKLEISQKSGLEASEVKGALIIGNRVYKADEIKERLKEFSFGYTIMVINGGVIIGGTDSNMRADGLYRLFERHGMKFYLKNLRESRLRPGQENLEILPDSKEIVFRDSYSEKVRFAATMAYDEDGLRANPRTTRGMNEKVYTALYSGHAHDLMVPYSIYGKDHPEYYALLSNGKRLDKRKSMGIHLCMSNPEIPAIAAERICRWIEEQPWAVYFDISPGDGPNWCTCDKCQALDVKGHGKADRLWQFNNKVAALVKEKHPDKKLVCLAYTPNAEMPPANAGIADNCIVSFAPYCWGGARSQNHLLTDRVNRVAYQNFQDWMKILKPDQMIGFEYPPSYFPVPSAGMRPMFEKIKLMASYPQVFAFDYCGYSRHSFYKLSRYVLAELEWNPELDTRNLVENFMVNYYGSAAPHMQAVYDLNAALTEKQPHNQRCEYYAPGFPAHGNADKFYALFDKAEKAVANDPVILKHVQVEKVPYLYVDLNEYNPANGKAPLTDDSFPRKLQEFLNLCVNVKNAEYRAYYGASFLKTRTESIAQWLRNICGFTPDQDDIYKSKLIAEFLTSEDPAAFLKQHCRPENMNPYGIRIGLKSADKVIRYTQRESRIQEAANDAPQSELWGGEKDSKTNTFDVIALRGGEESKVAIEFIDNPFDGELEITAKNENTPCEATISIKWNKEFLQQKVKFESPEQWVVFKIGTPASAMRYGQNKFVIKNESAANNNRLLIQSLKLLY